MGRAARRDIEGGWHHVVNRGADRQRIFFTKDDGEAFENLLAQASARLGVEVHAYCLMPNHYHLLLHCPNAGLSSFMHLVGAGYSRRFNDRKGGDGPVFKARFRARLIGSPQYLAEVGRYIHRNPEDLSPPVDLVTYRWSSLRYYVGLQPAPTWLQTSTLLAYCSGDYLSYIDAAA